MSIYEKNGVELSSAYDLYGSVLSQAYDIGGNELLTPTELKIMTYNVGQWYIGNGTNTPTAKDSSYYDLQNGMLQNDQPDILFLNEYTKNMSQTGRTAKSMLDQYFPYIHEQNAGTNSGYFGRAICSKWPISNYTAHSFSTGGDQYYDSCDIMVDNVAITLIVTHLQYSSGSQTTKLQQFSELLDYLETLTTFICCGDLNSLDCKSSSGTDYTDMILPLLNNGFHCANCTDFGFLETYSDHPTGTWTGCLDNIVTSANLPILSASVDTTKLTDGINEKTDHMPLIATVKLI